MTMYMWVMTLLADLTAFLIAAYIRKETPDANYNMIP